MGYGHGRQGHWKQGLHAAHDSPVSAAPAATCLPPHRPSGRQQRQATQLHKECCLGLRSGGSPARESAENAAPVGIARLGAELIIEWNGTGRSSLVVKHPVMPVAAYLALWLVLAGGAASLTISGELWLREDGTKTAS